MDRTSCIVASCTAALASIAAYTLYRSWKREVSISEKDPNSATNAYDTSNISAQIRNFKKDNLSFELASFIAKSLETLTIEDRVGYLNLIHQASSFSSNYPTFRRSRCLDSMLSLLNDSVTVAPVTRQNLIILQSAINLACDPAHIDIIQNHLDVIINLANVKTYSDQACAALQLLCNLALLPAGCRALDDQLNTIISVLQTRDIHILRQILSVLINLSCDQEGCSKLLNSQIPDGFMNVFNYCLSPSMKPVIALQAIRLLKNLYSQIIEAPDSVVTLKAFLVTARSEIKLRIFLFRSEPEMSEACCEATKEAEALNKLLEEFKFQSDVYQTKH